MTTGVLQHPTIHSDDVDAAGDYIQPTTVTENMNKADGHLQDKPMAVLQLSVNEKSHKMTEKITDCVQVSASHDNCQPVVSFLSKLTTSFTFLMNNTSNFYAK